MADRCTEPDSATPPRVGVLLPSFDVLRRGRTPDLIAGARLAEALGFDAGWVGDHLACNVPVLDAGLALSAAAAVTERIELGFSVMLLGLREPRQASEQIAAIDALSGGRLTLGVGVGGEHPEEFAAAGVPHGRRGRRLDEMLDVVPELVAGGAVDFAGATVEVHAAAIPGARRRIPRILIGGRGEVALRRAARRGDGWLPMWLSPDAVRDGARQLRALAVDARRPGPRPRIVMLVLTCVDDDAEHAREVAAEHLSTQYRLPLHVVERWAALGPAAVVAERLAAYVAAGVDELILMPLGGAPLEQYARMAEVRTRLRRA